MNPTDPKPGTASLKLYHVTVERDICVLASSVIEAEEIARRHERDEMSSGGEPALYAREVKDLKRVPQDWWESFPYAPRDYHDKDLKTVEEIIAALYPTPALSP